MWHVSQAFITHPSSHREDCLHCGDFLSIFLVSNSPWLLKYLWPPFTDSGRRPDAPGRTDDYWVESSQRGKPRDCLIVCLIGFRWFSTCFADIVLSFTSFFFQNYRFFISYLYSCWIRKIIYFGIKKRKWVQQIFIYLFFQWPLSLLLFSCQLEVWKLCLWARPHGETAESQLCFSVITQFITSSDTKGVGWKRNIH